VQANVSLTVLGNLKLLIPEKSVMQNWNKIIKTVYGKVKNNNSQIQTLKKNRDTLLPKLISGEIRVKP
jgi:type I restriction enzyme, S subunit